MNTTEFVLTKQLTKQQTTKQLKIMNLEAEVEGRALRKNF